MTPAPPDVHSASLRLTGISKRFSNRQVLRSLDVTFYGGELALILGANGSGKSTLLRICSGLLRPEEGIRELSGGPIGYVAHEPMVYAHLTVRENLRLFAALGRAPARRPGELITALGLEEYLDTRASELSRGWQVRLSVARSLLHSPAVILLDEPSSSLDDAAVEHLIGLLSAHVGAGGAAVVATHDLHRLGPIAQRVVLLHDGKIENDSRAVAGAPNGTAMQSVIDDYHRRNR